MMTTGYAANFDDAPVPGDTSSSSGADSAAAGPATPQQLVRALQDAAALHRSGALDGGEYPVVIIS